MTARLGGWLGILGLSFAGLLGCEKPPVPQHQIAITVTSDGQPLTGVRVALEHHSEGVTDANGTALFTHQAPDGTRLKGGLTCPEGFTTSQNEFVVVLTQVRSMQTGKIAPIQEALVCTPTERDNVLLVRTGFPDIGISVDGREVAKTDAYGVAHVLLRRPPAARIGVALDTSAHRYVKPVNPNTTLVAAEQDDVLVYAPTLVDDKPKPKRRRRVKKPKKHVPIRLD